jgi:hypothetical protein
MIIIKIEEVVSSATNVDLGSRRFFLNLSWNTMPMMQDFLGFCQVTVGKCEDSTSEQISTTCLHNVRCHHSLKVLLFHDV